MFKLSSKHYYLRHENEIQRFLSSNSNWIHIINRDNSFKNFTNTSENLFLIDLDSNLSKQIYKIEDQKFDLIVITDIFEVTDDIYELLNSLNKLLTNNGKILINSIYPGAKEQLKNFPIYFDPRLPNSIANAMKKSLKKKSSKKEKQINDYLKSNQSKIYIEKLFKELINI